MAAAGRAAPRAAMSGGVPHAHLHHSAPALLPDVAHHALLIQHLQGLVEVLAVDVREAGRAGGHRRACGRVRTMHPRPCTCRASCRATHLSSSRSLTAGAAGAAAGVRGMAGRAVGARSMGVGVRACCALAFVAGLVVACQLLEARLADAASSARAPSQRGARGRQLGGREARPQAVITPTCPAAPGR